MSNDKRRFPVVWKIVIYFIILLIVGTVFVLSMLKVFSKPDNNGEAQNVIIMKENETPSQDIASINILVFQKTVNYYSKSDDIKPLELVNKETEIPKDLQDSDVESTIQKAIPEHDYYYVIDELGRSHYLPKEIQDYAYKMLEEYGIEEYYKLFIALIWHESHFKEDAVSPTDDHGYCQINAGNFEWLMQDLGLTDIPNNSYENIHAGVDILFKALNSNNFDVEPALVCYNAGRAYTDSNDYSQCVLNDYNKLVLLEEGENK